MLKISSRGANMPASPIRKLQGFADQAKKDGKTIYHLNIGQPDIETPPNMLKAVKNFDSKVIAYGPSQGLPEYQDALISYYRRHKIELTRDNIIVTTGGSEAIIMALVVCMDPGDEIIIPEPFYANYNGFAVAAGVKVKPLTTKLEDDWELPSVEEIEKVIGSKTRAIMICNPNNPTGKVYNKEQLTKIANLAQKHDLFILGDEVYREFIFSGEKHTSILDFKQIEDRVVVMDSISKRFSSCGARIGTLVSKNKQVMKAALSYAQARLCAPTLEQILAIPSIELDDSYFSKILAEYKNRRDIVTSALQEMEGVKFKVPNGAFYIIVKLPVTNAENFVKWLLTDFHVDGETVMLAPANGFYNTPGLGLDEVRIAFVLNEQKTKKAMNILKSALATYKD